MAHDRIRGFGHKILNVKILNIKIFQAREDPIVLAHAEAPGD